MHTSRILTASAALTAVAVLASACGSSGTAATTTDAVGGYAANGSGGTGSGQVADRPGAFGTIAAVDGKVVQVQNDTSGQVAVRLTSTTTITDQAKASKSAVEVGTCVVVRPSDTSSSSTAVTASSVSVTTSSGSSCTNGFGGARSTTAGGPGGGTPPSGMPSGAPSGMPTDMPANGGGRGFGVMGKVTAVSAKGFTVASSMPGSTSSSVIVTTTGSTTYTAQEKASLSALKVGRCLQATGTTDSTGAVTATRASVSDAVDGSCSTGFGGRPGSAS